MAYRRRKQTLHTDHFETAEMRLDDLFQIANVRPFRQDRHALADGLGFIGGDDLIAEPRGTGREVRRVVPRDSEIRKWH